MEDTERGLQAAQAVDHSSACITAGFDGVSKQARLGARLVRCSAAIDRSSGRHGSRQLRRQQQEATR
jgi:hypothetical protein